MKKILFNSFFLIAVNCTVFSQTLTDADAPSNVGGKNEFKRVFEQELIYPKAALAKKVSGKVTIHFTVNKDSTASDVKVTESPSPEIEKEALRIFKLYQWVPARRGNATLTATHNVTFNFDSDKYAKITRERGFKQFKYLPKMKIDSSFVVRKTAEQMPMYPTGTFALQDFIKQNLEYPRQAQIANIQGTVMVRFVVEPSGLPTNIGLETSIGGGCDQEAIRIIEMIKWYPAKNDDTLVRAQMKFPIYFILNEDFKDNSAGEQK
jgi:TonB family protein